MEGVVDTLHLIVSLEHIQIIRVLPCLNVLHDKRRVGQSVIQKFSQDAICTTLIACMIEEVAPGGAVDVQCSYIQSVSFCHPKSGALVVITYYQLDDLPVFIISYIYLYYIFVALANPKPDMTSVVKG